MTAATFNGSGPGQANSSHTRGGHMGLNSYCSKYVARVAVMLLALLAGWSGVLHAQGAGNASVLGTVTDSAGAVVPGASVTVKNIATGRVQEVPTDEQGRYTIADLPIGGYDAQASLAGFQTTVRRGITLTVGAQVIVDFSLSVGRTQESVTVESQVSQIDTVSTAVAAYVEAKQINDPPLNGRNFTDLVALAPGVATGSQIGNAGTGTPNLLYGVESNFSVSGSRPEGQAYL